MGMTMSQKILAAHTDKKELKAGELIEADIDLVLGNDITSPVAIREMGKIKADKVYDKDKVVLVMDHFVPNKDIKSAENVKTCREFACSQCIEKFYDVGRMGIEHALIPEQGLCLPGDLIIGADSHTVTYGAMGAFSTGVGSTDMAAAMATGKLWFKVPGAIKINLKGKPGKYVTGKDLILDIIGRIGVDGALYESMEFAGEGVAELSMDDRLAICNMAIEAGGKNGIFPVDEKTLDYAARHLSKKNRGLFGENADIEEIKKGIGSVVGKIYEADEDACYEEVLDIDLSKLRPTVSFPHLPSNTKTIDEAEALKVKIDQVVIGSCTNGRISDMRAAAEVLKGRKVADNVRCIVIPATQEIYLQSLREGLLEIFIEAGAVVSTPTCGPCLGGHMGILADGERCVSTTNRNFVGRMGAKTSEVYLASPYVAAASAVSGFIAGPESVM
ncbi:MAG: 3-isopropylmalate dehydratase large subunit [Candidatus Avilachnospira sp.]|jgi:3-isopropylmalate/(R)-2-methylmalate dehydratase large subunit